MRLTTRDVTVARFKPNMTVPINTANEAYGGHNTSVFRHVASDFTFCSIASRKTADSEKPPARKI